MSGFWVNIQSRVCIALFGFNEFAPVMGDIRMIHRVESMYAHNILFYAYIIHDIAIL